MLETNLANIKETAVTVWIGSHLQRSLGQRAVHWTGGRSITRQHRTDSFMHALIPEGSLEWLIASEAGVPDENSVMYRDNKKTTRWDSDLGRT